MSCIIGNRTQKVPTGHIRQMKVVIIVHLLKFKEQQVDIGSKTTGNLNDIKAIPNKRFYPTGDRGEDP